MDLPPPQPPKSARLASRRGLGIGAEASGVAGLFLVGWAFVSLLGENIRCSFDGACRLGFIGWIIGAAAAAYGLSGLLFLRRGQWRRGAVVAASGLLLLASNNPSERLLWSSLVVAAVSMVAVTVLGVFWDRSP